ncbi:MAG TPA: protocatechuate 3,4-dioxygenase [Verrucomicrobiales bacterium]|jgi:protocatechuate 3,4-dioxygenase beta subunit|nr:protocatechuate 3,4-dioxygenase [Verrucomicrobiales bacterium]
MNLITSSKTLSTRREILRRFAAGSALLAAPGAFAEALLQTPSATEGPFYPDHLPLDTDNDLLLINAGTTSALGDVAYVSGRILDSKGNPLRNAVVEIWQCDNNGAYLHSGTGNADKKDKNFQGFGRFMTGSTGEYLFRTIKPVKYPGRCPHIHYKVKYGGKDLLTTQLYIKGCQDNEKDGIWRSIKDPKARESVTVDFAPLPGAKAGELAAKFDIVLGYTPEG